jgi:hypothetical protein
MPVSEAEGTGIVVAIGVSGGGGVKNGWNVWEAGSKTDRDALAGAF